MKKISNVNQDNLFTSIINKEITRLTKLAKKYQNNEDVKTMIESWIENLEQELFYMEN